VLFVTLLRYLHWHSHFSKFIVYPRCVPQLLFVFVRSFSVSYINQFITRRHIFAFHTLSFYFWRLSLCYLRRRFGSCPLTSQLFLWYVPLILHFWEKPVTLFEKCLAHIFIFIFWAEFGGLHNTNLTLTYFSSFTSLHPY